MAKKSFIKQVRSELKHMTWPTMKEWAQSTTFVVLSSALIVLTLLVFDILFYSIRDRYIIGIENIWQNIRYLVTEN